MTKEIERAGIPIVHVTNLINIADGVGSNRILQGKSVLHVFGDPTLSPEAERDYRKDMVAKALKMLEDASS